MIVVDVVNIEQLERELEHIRAVFNSLKNEEKPLRIEWGTKTAFEETAQKAFFIKEELTKALAISIARRVKSAGDWWAYWLGRMEAYEEALALVTNSEQARLVTTVVTEENLKLAKEMKLL